MARRVYVRLDRASVDALAQLAAKERRHPADQGAVLLTDALRRVGMLPTDAPKQSVGVPDGRS
jgi:hypothetical protein